MAIKILMFYGKGCANSIVMMPALMALNMGSKYKFEFHDVWNDSNAKKLKEKFSSIIEEEKKDYVPIFVDEKKKKAVYAPDFESLMAWLEGPNWWKKYY